MYFIDCDVNVINFVWFTFVSVPTRSWAWVAGDPATSKVVFIRSTIICIALIWLDTLLPCMKIEGTRWCSPELRKNGLYLVATLTTLFAANSTNVKY